MQHTIGSQVLILNFPFVTCSSLRDADAYSLYYAGTLSKSSHTQMRTIEPFLFSERDNDKRQPPQRLRSSVENHAKKGILFAVILPNIQQDDTQRTIQNSQNSAKKIYSTKSVGICCQDGSSQIQCANDIVLSRGNMNSNSIC